MQVGRQISTLPSKNIEIPISEINHKHQNYVSTQNIKTRKLNSTFAFEKTTSSDIRQLIFKQKFISQDFIFATPARKTEENHHFCISGHFLIF